MSQWAIGGNVAGSRWTWRTSAIPWLGGAALLFAISFALTVFSDIGTGRYLIDESWFLQVVNRMTSGEVLYRDIAFGITPLSVYLTALVTQLFGNAYLAAAALWSAWLVVLLLVTLRIARQLGWGQGAMALLPLALIVFMVPWLWSPYSLLAMVWLMICCSATLSWISRQSVDTAIGGPADRWLAVAGAAAGLCFVTKQNLGVYALAALGVVAVTAGQGWASRRQWPRRIALIGGAFLLAVIAGLLPVVASGAGAGFLEYGFTNKGTFVRAVGYDYATGLIEAAARFNMRPSLATFELLYWQLLNLLPPIAIVALLIASLRAAPAERDRAVAILMFTLAATLIIYPRSSLPYVVHALPLVLLGLGYAVQRLAPGALAPHAMALRTVVGLWLLLGAVMILIEPLSDLVSGDFKQSNLPHFQGMPYTGSSADYFRTAEKLSERSTEEDAVMVLSLRAGFLYLASGLDNPTPFDYPQYAAFGHHGERDVIEALSAGELREVCLDHDFSSTNDPRRLQPRELLSFVEQELKPRRDLGVCAIYRSRE